MGTTGYPPVDALEQPGTAAATISLVRDQEIYAQGDAAEHCYQVLSGCVRTVSLMPDGRRQIGEFLLPGDLFGWDSADKHDFAAEAVTPAVLRRYRRRGLEALAERDPEVARRLRQLAAAQMRVAHERMVLLGRKTAPERIASFLLEMAQRMPRDGGGLIALPMGRADIADYLGLTVETVCRSLTRLRLDGTIAIERARVGIRNRRALTVAGCETLH